MEIWLTLGLAAMNIYLRGSYCTGADVGIFLLAVVGVLSSNPYIGALPAAAAVRARRSREHAPRQVPGLGCPSPPERRGLRVRTRLEALQFNARPRDGP